jgi:arsenate reductase-like glutaredoxin family protein
MKVAENEILLIYNSKHIQDRSALGYAKSLKNHSIKEYDTQFKSLTELQLVDIIQSLDIEAAELIDRKSETYIKEYSEVDLDDKGILKALRAHPEIIKTPIAIFKDKAKFLDSSYELIMQDMVN